MLDFAFYLSAARCFILVSVFACFSVCWALLSWFCDLDDARKFGYCQFIGFCFSILVVVFVSGGCWLVVSLFGLLILFEFGFVV